MDIAPVLTNSAMTAVTRQLQTNAAIQTSIMKQLAESQQMMAEMLHSLGVGQTIDLSV